MQNFEFVIYDAKADYVRSEIYAYKSESGARARAGSLAKDFGGPVDLARFGEGDWADRYITTAAPSEFHAAGYVFERLDN